MKPLERLCGWRSHRGFTAWPGLPGRRRLGPCSPGPAPQDDRLRRRVERAPGARRVRGTALELPDDIV